MKKEEVIFFLFSHDMIVYVENLQKEQLLELITEFKIVGHRLYY